jgi:phosphatidylserine/phosphatidylglycerophosphate/cardiolipin synthase-like enzyme
MSTKPRLELPCTVRQLASYLREAYQLADQHAISAIYALLESGALQEKSQERDFFDNLVASKVALELLEESIKRTVPLAGESRHPSPAMLRGHVVATVPASVQIHSHQQWTNIVEAFTDLIKGCRKDLRIASPYIDEGGLNYFMVPLRNLRDRGGKVYLLTRIDNPSQPSPAQLRALLNLHDLLGEQCLTRSFALSVATRVGSGPIVLAGLHAKLLVADSVKAYVGSGEVRNNALNRNFEAGVVVEEAGAVEPLRNLFDAVWDASTPIDPQHLRKYFTR